MMLCPWKNPRNDEMTHTNKTAGPSAPMAIHAFGVSMNCASCLQKSSIPAEPMMPIVRKT